MSIRKASHIWPTLHYTVLSVSPHSHLTAENLAGSLTLGGREEAFIRHGDHLFHGQGWPCQRNDGTIDVDGSPLDSCISVSSTPS